MLLAVAQYYPSASGGFHLTAGAGPASVVLEGLGGGAENYGAALRVGAGYDIRSRRLGSLSFTPYATLSSTNLRERGIRVSGNAGAITALQLHRIAQAGLALRWY